MTRIGTDFLLLKSAIVLFFIVFVLASCQLAKEAEETAVSPPPTIMPANTSEPYPAPPTAILERGYPNGSPPLPRPVSPTPTVFCMSGNELNVSLTETFDPFTALLVLYGDGCIDNENRSVTQTDEAGNQWIISPIIAVPHEEDGRSKMIFLTQKTRPGWKGLCHPCGAIIGAFLFSWEDEKWQVVFQKDLFREGGLGSFGLAPPANAIQLGLNTPGILFRGVYTSTGNSSEYVVIIAPWHDELQVVASLQTGAREVVNNSWDYTSKLEIVTGNHPEFDDIRVVTSGTKWIIDAIRPFTETHLYVFEDGQYRLEE